MMSDPDHLLIYQILKLFKDYVCLVFVGRLFQSTADLYIQIRSTSLSNIQY